MVAKLDVGWGVDKTGAISACLWGDVAEDICCIWRDVHESRVRGEGKACVVELNKVRIQGVVKNNWNGECITRHRVLSSVENVNREGGTTLKMLKRPTSVAFCMGISSRVSWLVAAGLLGMCCMW